MIPGVGRLYDLLFTRRCPGCLCTERHCRPDVGGPHCQTRNCPACTRGCDHPDHIHPEGAGR